REAGQDHQRGWGVPGLSDARERSARHLVRARRAAAALPADAGRDRLREEHDRDLPDPDRAHQAHPGRLPRRRPPGDLAACRAAASRARARARARAPTRRGEPRLIPASDLIAASPAVDWVNEGTLLAPLPLAVLANLGLREHWARIAAFLVAGAIA